MPGWPHWEQPDDWKRYLWKRIRWYPTGDVWEWVCVPGRKELQGKKLRGESRRRQLQTRGMGTSSAELCTEVKSQAETGVKFQIWINEAGAPLQPHFNSFMIVFYTSHITFKNIYSGKFMSMQINQQAEQRYILASHISKCDILFLWIF